LKATTAAHWRRPTVELWERVNTQINRAPEWMGDLAQPGGFPILVGNEMVGAIGAGGGHRTPGRRMRGSRDHSGIPRGLHHSSAMTAELNGAPGAWRSVHATITELC
jgi:hypothetical protein